MRLCPDRASYGSPGWSDCEGFGLTCRCWSGTLGLLALPHPSNLQPQQITNSALRATRWKRIGHGGTTYFLTSRRVVPFGERVSPPYGLSFLVDFGKLNMVNYLELRTTRWKRIGHGETTHFLTSRRVVPFGERVSPPYGLSFRVDFGKLNMVNYLELRTTRWKRIGHGGTTYFLTSGRVAPFGERVSPTYGLSFRVDFGKLNMVNYLELRATRWKRIGHGRFSFAFISKRLLYKF